MKKKVLITSVVTIILCLCLIAGSTFALFTSTTSVNVAVTSGTVDVVATIDGLKTWSLGETEANARAGSFTNGGYAKIEDGKLIIDRMTPGDVVKFTIKVIDNSNVAAQFRVSGQSITNNIAANQDLAPALDVDTTVSGNTHHFANGAMATKWIEADRLGFAYDANGNKYFTIEVTITFPNGTPEHDNQFQDRQCNLQFVVEAVQANGVDAQDNLILPANP